MAQKTKTDLMMVAVTALTALPIVPRAYAQGLDLGTITVEAQQIQPPVLFAGEPVAQSASIGILGDRPLRAIPFSLTVYSGALANERQARSVADMLQSDTSVSQVFPQNSYRDAFYIRGFSYFTYNMLFDGLPGMTPKQKVVPQNFERLELLKGPDTFVHGMALGGAVGGSINLVPKRAPDEPLMQATLGYASDAQFSSSIDWARRSEDKRFGLRVNATQRDGDLAISGQSETLSSVTLGTDFRGEAWRLSADLGYQRARVNQPDWALPVAAGQTVPPPPRATANLSQDWSFFTTRDTFAKLGAEYDVSPGWIAYAKGGLSWTETEGIYGAPSDLQSDGTFTVRGNSFPSAGTHAAAEAGLRGQFTAGAVAHDITVAASVWRQRLKVGGGSFGPAAESSIYAPVTLPTPNEWLTVAELGRTAVHRFTSVAVGDTMSLPDNRTQVTIGARKQWIRSQSFNGTTGTMTGDYDDSRTTPAIGLTYALSDQISVYGNYVEGLQAASVSARGNYANAGEALPPYVARQAEAGVKGEWNGMGASVALFRIRQPTGTVSAANVYAMQGEQRNSGLEVSMYGEATPDVRITGGITAYDATLSGTTNGANDGNRPVGIPVWQAVLGADWNMRNVPELTLSGRIIHTAEQYADEANIARLPSWTRFDAGASYRTEASGRPVVLRATVENVLNRNYWSAASTGQINGISRGAGRTLIVSATVNF